MSDWRESQIGDEIELVYGKSLPGHAREAGTFKVYGSNGCVGSHSSSLVSGPGIVIGRKGSVGKVVYSKQDFWPIDTTYYVVNKNGHNWRFLYHLLSCVGLDELNSHSAVPGLNREIAYAIPITLPDKAEQQRIASVLDTIESALRREGSAIENSQNLKSTAMHTLFTRGLRGEPQKETEIGSVPESWAVMPFDKAISLKRGFDLPISKRQEGSVPVFGSNGIVGRHHKWPHGIPIPGVMVGRSGSVGRVSFSADAYWPLNTTLFAEDFRGNIERFMAHFLDSFDFSSFAAGVSVPTLNRNSFAGVKVGIPLVPEQREIAAILSSIDRKIDLHQRKRAVLEELFKALLHKLMTGEIRVGELDSPGDVANG